MGIGSNLAVELAEQRYFDEKREWIIQQTGNDDIDEFSPEWDELSDAFDELTSGEFEYDDWHVEGKSRIEIFDETILASKEVLSYDFSPVVSKNILVMLHGHIIAAVEAYLSSTFIDLTLSSDEYIRKLVESDPEFAERKFTVKEIFTTKENLNQSVGKYLQDLIFHNISKVSKLYESVLSIDFGQITWLYKAVSLRHHCVHRAGYDKDGNEVNMSRLKIHELLANAGTLVHSIEKQVKALHSPS